MAASREDETHRIDIMMLGYTYVGAKNLVRRFAGQPFDDNSPATIAAVVNEVHREVDGTDVNIRIWSLLHLKTHATVGVCDVGLAQIWVGLKGIFHKTSYLSKKRKGSS